MTLADTWRTIHPSDRDCMFYSMLHDRYLHIDYLFTTQRDLPNLKGANIGIISFPEHAPIAITLKLTETLT